MKCSDFHLINVVTPAATVSPPFSSEHHQVVFTVLYCPSKLIISLTHDVFLVSLFLRIVSSLNNIHLHLFMIIKVNVALL